jgi:formylglycine-generating enzyme required for sulfatase activity
MARLLAFSPSRLLAFSPSRLLAFSPSRLLAFLTLCICVVVLPPREGQCSKIKITNPTLGTLSGGSTTVTFNVTWTNSWRSTSAGAPAPNNWDAAWVFVKFRKNGGNWAHASLNDTGHSMGTGTAATYSVGYPDTSSAFNIATNPGVGVFIYRSGDGTGTFTLTGASLSWNYSQDGVTGSDTVDIQVYGIEMVYAPQGAFFAGDNATSATPFKQGSSDKDPWYIGGEGAISTTNTAGTGTGLAEKAAEYYYPCDPYGVTDGAGSIFTIPATFPKGYQAFYMMKGEVSQGQWVAFFNTLTATQKTTRDITSATNSGKNSDTLTYRNNVSWTGSGDATLPDQGGGATYEGVAMNYLSWADLTAYLDWSGLRPMSELEFERSARGPYRAVSSEDAWGTNQYLQVTSISNPGLPTERAQGGQGSAAYGAAAGVQGPVRVGSFAYGVSTRIAAGAGYYGAMELSGNVWEATVTVGISTGRSFAGRYHGNGALSSTGDADASTWPGTAGLGGGWRGGGWDSNYQNVRTSDRLYVAKADANRGKSRGGRGVRVAP